MELTTKPAYKQTEVGLIPQDWEAHPLEHYFNYISYGFTNPMPTSSSGIYMITARDVNNGEILYDSARLTTESAFNKFLSNKSKPIKNDLLLTKDGTLGRLALVGEKKICINQSVAVIRPNSKIDPNFLQKLLESSYYQRVMLENAGGSTIKHIYITIVNKMLLGVPPTLTEQKAIATALSDLDALIVSLEQTITEKKDIKQGAMQQLLTPPHKGGKRLPGFSGEWVEKKLGGVSHIKTGSRNNQDKVADGEYPFYVRSQSVKRIDSYSYDEEAILIPGEGGIGTIFHYVNGKFEVHQRVYKISSFSEGALGKFIFFKMRHEFFAHAMTNSVKATVDSLRLPTFQEFEIYLPPTLTEQKAIAQILSDMDADITQLERKKGKHQAIKQGMMQELLTGKTRLV
jgi:type I restriction enzyme S subunit